MISGICGGLAEYFNIDATIIRLIFVFGALLGVGSFLLIYIVMWFVVPEEPVGGVQSPSPISPTQIYDEPSNPEDTSPPIV